MAGTCSDQAAEAETEQIGLGNAQMVQQRDDVTGQRLDRHRAAGVGGVPMPLGAPPRSPACSPP
jgi:hypothetical protein